MRNALKIVALLALVALAIGYLFREPLKEMAFAQLTKNMFVASDTDSFDPRSCIEFTVPGPTGHLQRASDHTTGRILRTQWHGLRRQPLG